VASLPLKNGMMLLVYPMSEGMIVGFGLERDRSNASKLEDVLRKRSGDLRRFGGWLPATFLDGSCHVFRRLPEANLDSGEPPLSAAEMSNGEELLA
jgi:hypothetical protein